MRSWKLACLGLASIAASAGVAYLAAVNRHLVPAAPGGWLARAAYVLAPAAAGIYAWARHPEERLGRLLILLAAATAVWTLNGSSDPALFAVARLVGVFVAPLLSYVALSFPEGRLHSRLEWWVLAGSGVVIVFCWVPLVFITRQPVILTPLVRCAPHCPRNVLFAGGVPALARVLELGVRFGYAALLVGVVCLLVSRLSRSTVAMRRILAPVLAASILYAAALALYLAVRSRGAGVIAISGWIVIVTVPMISLALFVGVARERLFVRSALAQLITDIPAMKDREQVGTAMAAAFKDDSLQILPWRSGDRGYVDHDGTPVPLPGGVAPMAVTELESNGEPVAAIVYDPALAEESRLIRAIAGAAMLGIEKAQLESELQESRTRLVRAATFTRERIERDLHDGAQQQLVAVRIRLGLAAAAIEAGADDAAEMVRRIGCDVETALEELRRLAHGMPPKLLTRHGLGPALKDAALRTTLPTTVHTSRIARYDPEIEAAVYFCCVEALQNAAKHAGPDASITVILSDERGSLSFEITDTGVGFDQRLQTSGSGLTHVRDRIGAVGGRATISSAPGRGTSIAGTIPVSD